jgi:hypothetical protein
MARARLVRLFWIGAAAVLTAAALIGIVAVVRGDLGDTDGKILVTLSALLLAGAAAVSALVLYESGVLRPLAVAALVPVPIGFALIAAWAWNGFEGDNLARWAGSGALALVACLVLATAGTLRPPRRHVALGARRARRRRVAPDALPDVGRRSRRFGGKGNRRPLDLERACLGARARAGTVRAPPTDG